MKKTKKEKQPVVTLYDVWTAGVTERVILEDGREIWPQNSYEIQFTPDGEWHRVINGTTPHGAMLLPVYSTWRKSLFAIVAYEFPDPNNVTSTGSAIMTTTTSLKDLLDNEPEKPVAPKAGITLQAGVLERMRKAQDKVIDEERERLDKANPYASSVGDIAGAAWWQFWK